MLYPGFQPRKAVDGRGEHGQSLRVLLRMFLKLGFIFRVRCLLLVYLLSKPKDQKTPMHHSLSLALFLPLAHC
jgi:hypothetical protein